MRKETYPERRANMRYLVLLKLARSQGKSFSTADIPPRTPPLPTTWTPSIPRPIIPRRSRAGKMRIKFGSCSGLLVMACGIAAAQNPQIASVSNRQWTITADAIQGAITVKDRVLGVLLQNAHLYVNSPNGRHELKQWQ